MVTPQAGRIEPSSDVPLRCIPVIRISGGFSWGDRSFNIGSPAAQIPSQHPLKLADFRVEDGLQLTANIGIHAAGITPAVAVHTVSSGELMVQTKEPVDVLENSQAIVGKIIMAQDQCLAFWEKVPEAPELLAVKTSAHIGINPMLEW